MTKIIESIGKTPLIQLQHIGNGSIYVKTERTNPAGSVKDRPAYYMIKEAIKNGELKEGMTIVEPTSGNTGIALAMIGKQLGYDVLLIMPKGMSVERRSFMKAFGAKLELIEEGGIKACVDRAKALVAEGGYYMPDQFSNPANVQSHEETTGPEIYEALPEIKGFAAGIGTGGTITGVGRFLRKQDASIKLYAAEPEESPLITQGTSGAHKIQGLGANFIPKNFDSELVDKVVTVKSADAIAMTKRLAEEEGLFVGISSGANVCAALQMAEEVEGPIVTVLPDGGERYLSTGVFSDVL